MIADGADDGAALLVLEVLVPVVGDLVGNDVRAAVAMSDILLLLLPLVVLVGRRNAFPLGTA